MAWPKSSMVARRRRTASSVLIAMQRNVMGVSLESYLRSMVGWGNAAGSDDRRSTAGPGDWARALGKVYPLLAFEFQKRTHGRCLTRWRSLSVRNFVCRGRRDAISRAAKRSAPARLRPLAREGALWHHPSRPATVVALPHRNTL